MKFIINENQFAGLRQKLRNSIETVGVYETLRRYNITLNILSVIFDGNMPDTSCSDLYELIRVYLRQKKFKEKTYKNLTFKFSFDSMGGVLEFECEDKIKNDFVTAFATPYWDGECHLPIDFQYFGFIGGGPESEFEISGDYFYIEDLPNKFNSFNDVIKWLNEDYLIILYDKCKEVFEYMREQ